MNKNDRYDIGETFPRIMEFVGVYIMISVACVPLDLIDGRHYGDGAILANIIWLPEIVWALFWCAIAVGTIVLLWSRQRTEQ